MHVNVIYLRRLTFEERAAGAPEAVKAWFYPGENYGHEFVYPKAKAMELAKAYNQTVPSMPQEMEGQTTSTQSETNANPSSVEALQQTPLMAQQPDQQESEVAQAYSSVPQPDNNTQPMTSNTQPITNYTQPSATTTANRERRLPKTASPLPLIGLLGLLSLGIAGSLRLFAAKVM